MMHHQHIYNMPGPQLASGANSLYGSLQGVPVHHHGGGVSPTAAGAAVHI